jgi:hypothetical protein
VADFIGSLTHLHARVRAIHSVLDPIAASRRATAALSVLNEGFGVRTIVIGSGGVDLVPRQVEAMAPEEVPAYLTRAHAEATVLSSNGNASCSRSTSNTFSSRSAGQG